MAGDIRKVKVAVVGANAGGSPDIEFFDIRCFESQYQNGDHYDEAKDLTALSGMLIAFDEHDPAWHYLSPDKMELITGADLTLQTGCN